MEPVGDTIKIDYPGWLLAARRMLSDIWREQRSTRQLDNRAAIHVSLVEQIPYLKSTNVHNQVAGPLGMILSGEMQSNLGPGVTVGDWEFLEKALAARVSQARRSSAQV